MSVRPPTELRDEVSRWVGAALATGVVASVGVVAVGIVTNLASITTAGLLLLVMTPVGHLLAALGAFVRRGERRYAIAAAAAVALLAGAMALAAFSTMIGD